MHSFPDTLKDMNKYLAYMIALVSVAMWGCGPTEPEGKIDEAGTSTGAAEGGTSTDEGAPKSTANQPTGDSSGINIHGAGAGGIAPVTGAENIQGSGGGGGVGQAAKSAAQNAAGSASSGSLDQMPADGE